MLNMLGGPSSWHMLKPIIKSPLVELAVVEEISNVNTPMSLK